MPAEIGQAAGQRSTGRQITPTFVQNLIMVLDPILIMVVGFICYAVYLWTRETPVESQFIVAIVVGGFLTSLFYQFYNVYPRDLLVSTRQPIKRIILGWISAFSLLLFIGFALKISDSFSRIWAVSWFLTTASVLVTSRVTLNTWITNHVRSGGLAARTIILGAGEQGQRLAAHLTKTQDSFIKVLGFIDDRKSRVPRSWEGYEVLGDTQDLLRLIRGNLVDQVIVALPWTASQRLSALIYTLALTPVRVCLATEPIDFEIPNRSVKFAGHIPILQVLDHPLTGWSLVAKDIEDRVLSFMILLFTAPILLCISLAIKLDSKGPVLFKQTRFGFNNQPIEVWKFRTMYDDSLDPGGALQATQDDPRVTRVGRFLRRSSLDELPQFFNVLFGDMSIVGPRPHPLLLQAGEHRFEDIVDRYAARHRVKPGITGWAQVNGWRGETESLDKMRGRVEHDLYYIDNWSLQLDFWIIVKTVIVIVRGNNAY